MDSAGKENGVKKDGIDGDTLAAGDWFEFIPFQNSVSTRRAVDASVAVHLFRTELPWGARRFHINRCFRDFAIKESRVHDWERFDSMAVAFKEQLLVGELLLSEMVDESWH